LSLYSYSSSSST